MKTSPSIVGRVEGGADVRLSTLEKFMAAVGFELLVNMLARIGKIVELKAA